MDNEFWRHSLRIYKQEGVEGLCLTLQDEFGLDVNVVLFCHWLGVSGLALSSEQLEDLFEQVDDWRQQVIEPLRILRRNMQTTTGIESVRGQIKLAELAAEQHQQGLMWCYYEDHKGSFIRNRSAWYDLLLDGIQASQVQECKELLSQFPS